ncbi:Rhamnogalacturonan acetylesterase [Ascosphaera pollenicola]|nr:Rhamnogalacturonan acetylesterase [Ascosphaera pollenicola]
MPSITHLIIAVLALSLNNAAWAVTLYLTGDSTMALHPNDVIDGWGQHLSGDVSIAVQNSATSGRSARSYTREGRFEKVANSLKKGDHVVIEFGHNDGGKLGKQDNGRTDCSGTGSETCVTTYDGKLETVLTFPAYIENAVALFKKKGAHVLVSSQTPNNPWETGKFIDKPTRFVEYAELAAIVSGAELTAGPKPQLRFHQAYGGLTGT